MSDLERTTVELVRPGLAVTHLAMVERNQRIIDATDADRGVRARQAARRPGPDL